MTVRLSHENISADIFKAFVIGLHHDRLHFTAVEFPERYFEWISFGIIPKGEFLIIRQSIQFDLSKVNSRIDATKMIIGLMRYISRD